MVLFKRYITFIIGLFINSLGVAIITKALLGTSPISAIPYVLSLNFDFTLGNFTIIFSLLLILLHVLILRKRFKLIHLSQIPVSILFGYFIDLCMFLLFFVNPTNYIISLLTLIIGCIVLGIGVYLEMLADVIMLPGESFVRSILIVFKTEFGITKIWFDVSLAVIAVILSLILAHKADGVREGTIIAALLVGFIARLINKLFPNLSQKLFTPKEKKQTNELCTHEKW